MNVPLLQKENKDGDAPATEPETTFSRWVSTYAAPELDKIITVWLDETMGRFKQCYHAMTVLKLPCFYITSASFQGDKIWCFPLGGGVIGEKTAPLLTTRIEAFLTSRKEGWPKSHFSITYPEPKARVIVTFFKEAQDKGKATKCVVA